jgi:hypothetical protein
MTSIVDDIAKLAQEFLSSKDYIRKDMEQPTVGLALMHAQSLIELREKLVLVTSTYKRPYMRSIRESMENATREDAGGGNLPQGRYDMVLHQMKVYQNAYVMEYKITTPDFQSRRFYHRIKRRK